MEDKPETLGLVGQNTKTIGTVTALLLYCYYKIDHIIF